MHLNAIKLRGFKSFPDAVELRLEPGVTVVVGPNGSGKSNVSDALVWAAGSLSPSELRAERPDDVLFAGAPGRGPASFCEVELLFDKRHPSRLYYRTPGGVLLAYTETAGKEETKVTLRPIAVRPRLGGAYEPSPPDPPARPI